ncbi:MAG: hypothetical protein GWO87_03410 [Xanthomonadaceae bacterium]|nr:hypothetical protein [Rhodospirillaceae bacterium]NIA18209.1 hypothetical protein [Xanthomonadaceae bacterium]
MNDIEERLAFLIKREWEIRRTIYRDSIFRFDFGFDSLDFVGLASGIEEEFDIVLELGDDDERLSKLKTVGEVALFVQQRIQQAAA